MVAINLIGIRLNSNQNTRAKVDIDCNEKVDRLKNDAAEKLNFQKDNLELTYCGNILSDDETLSKYGIKQGVTVHVLKKIQEEAAAPIKKMNDTDIQQLATAFNTFKLTRNYRSTFQRIARPEIIQNIIGATPELNKDLVSLAILKDPELLIHLTDSQVLQRILELHPSLIDVATHIAASIHEEASNINLDAPGTSSGYSYSLEALSDDDMDSPSSEGQSSGQPSMVTAAQLAAALANTQVPVSATASPSNLGGFIITNEMFTNAMQQAFANVSDGQPVSGQTNEEESIESITRRLAPQLNQMRELGLNNLVTNIQALQATGGDVQAAIDLVFSGVLSPGI